MDHVSGTQLTHLFGQDISYHTPEPKDLSTEQSPQGLSRVGQVKGCLFHLLHWDSWVDLVL